MVCCKVIFAVLSVTAASDVIFWPLDGSQDKLPVQQSSVAHGDKVYADGQLDLTMKQKRITRTAKKDLGSRWPNGNIPFKFGSDFTPAEKANVVKAVNTWNGGTCLNFYEDANISPNRPHLVLKETGWGCRSFVGRYNRTSTSQTVHLAYGCRQSASDIMHELGHALGLWHEQDRPYREFYLNIYPENMSPEGSSFMKHPETDVETHGLYYDYSSIMQYNAFAYSKNGRMTLVPKQPLQEALMGKAKTPSFRDFKLVNAMYGCTDRCQRTRCANYGYGAWHYKSCRCMCPSGFGGASCNNRVHAEPECLHTITTPGKFSTPNYPNQMPVNKRCAWLIKAPIYKWILVKFNTFDLHGRSENECHWDSLRIRKRDLQSDDPGTVYCGDELKTQIVYADKEMLLVLSTFAYASDKKGFEASVSFV